MHVVAIIRQHQGDMNQSEYAAYLGVGVTSISQLYSGIRTPGPVIIGAFLRRFPEQTAAIGQAQLADATAQPIEVG